MSKEYTKEEYQALLSNPEEWKKLPQKEKFKLKMKFDPTFKYCVFGFIGLSILLIVLVIISICSAGSSKSNYGLLFRTYELGKRYNTHPNFGTAQETFTDRGQRFFTTGFDYLAKKPADSSADKQKLADNLINETTEQIKDITTEPVQQQEQIRDTSINAESGITGTTYESGENVDIKPEAVSNSGQVVETSPTESFGTCRYMNNFGDLTNQGLNSSKIAQAEENAGTSVSLDQQAMAEKMGFTRMKK